MKVIRSFRVFLDYYGEKTRSFPLFFLPLLILSVFMCFRTNCLINVLGDWSYIFCSVNETDEEAVKLIGVGLSVLI